MEPNWKGPHKNDDAHPIWKQIKDDMKDDSILQHEEACKALEPTFDAIDRALAMSLLLVIKKYDSPKNATAIAALRDGTDNAACYHEQKGAWPIMERKEQG